MTSTTSKTTYPVELSIVLPAYHEEENLRVLLPRLKAMLAKLGASSEILVVDTLKPLDLTEQACLENDVRYVRRVGGNTFGDAVRTGIANARGEYMIFMDADGSHTPEFIPELYRRKNEGEVVIASRYVEGGFTENSSSLVWMSKALNWTYSFVLNLNCKDVSNSFKLYKGDLLRAIRLSCNNFDIVEEILFKMSREQKPFRIVEIPFTFKKRMFGQTKRNLVLFIATYLFTIVRLRLSIR